MYVKLLLVYILMQGAFCDKVDHFNVGVLLENKDQELLYDFVVDLANSKQGDGDVKINLVKAFVEPDNPFSALKGACSLLKHAVISIFGPTSPSSIDAVHSVCRAKHIPHLLTNPYINYTKNFTLDSIQLNFYPSTGLTKMFLTILTYLGWKECTVLYPNIDRLSWFQEFIDQAKYKDLVVHIINVNLDPHGYGDFRLVIEEITKFRQKNFIVDGHPEDVTAIFRQLKGLGMLTSGYKYFLTSLDTINLQSINEGADIYKVRLSDLELDYTTLNDTSLDYWKTHHNDLRTILVQDAFLALISPLWKLRELAMADYNVTPNSSMDCNNKEVWTGFKRYMYSLVTETEYAETVNTVNLDVFNSSSIRSEIMGTYHFMNGFVKDLPSRKRFPTDYVEFPQTIVMTTLMAPFIMRKVSDHKLSGNDQFEGYVIDLLDALCKKMDNCSSNSFTIVIREDGQNGIYDPLTNQWNGIIQDIMEGRATMAITDLTITSEREAVVDFTDPFMNFDGISIIFQKPQVVPSSFWYFARPFPTNFWLAIALIFVAVVLSLFIVGRLTPSEWRKTCNQSHYIVNHLTPSNSLWFATGGLFGQGTHVKISSVPARIIAGSWWIFCYALIALYTAALFFDLYLNEGKGTALFSDYSDLVANAHDLDIKYGAKLGGTTEQFFKRNPAFEDLYLHMDNHREDMVSSTEDGIRRAIQSRYAMFMESSVMEYYTNTHCDLQIYGGRLGYPASYGIALQKGNVFTYFINEALNELAASGLLDKLKEKWWKKNTQVCENIQRDISPLQTQEFIGPFYITLTGLILAMLCGVLEFSYYVYKLSQRVRRSFYKTFKYEMKKSFTVNVKNMVDSNLIRTLIADNEEGDDDDDDPVSEIVELSLYDS